MMWLFLPAESSNMLWFHFLSFSKLVVRVASDFPNATLKARCQRRKAFTILKEKAYTQPNYQLSTRVEYNLYNIFYILCTLSRKVLHQIERVIHLRKIHEVRKQGNPTQDRGNPVKGIPSLMLGRALMSHWQTWSRRQGSQERCNQEQY